MPRAYLLQTQELLCGLPCMPGRNILAHKANLAPRNASSKGHGELTHEPSYFPYASNQRPGKPRYPATTGQQECYFGEIVLRSPRPSGPLIPPKAG